MPGVLQSMQLQRIRHALAIEQQKCMCMCQECPLYMIPSAPDLAYPGGHHPCPYTELRAWEHPCRLCLNEVLSFTL